MNTENYQPVLNLQSTSTDEQNFNPINIDTSNINNSLHGEMSQFIENFDKMNTKEMVYTTLTNEDISSEKNLSKIVTDIINYLFKVGNEGKDSTLKKHILDYFNDNNINSQEIYNCLHNNQNYNSNSIFLLGYLNYDGIGTNLVLKNAFNLFINASKQDHILAQYFVGIYYHEGHGTNKNEKLAFEYFEKVANRDCAIGQMTVGYCYNSGFGINKEPKIAIYWCGKAANNGNIAAMRILGDYYEYGKVVEKDINKAIYWYKKAIEQGYEKA
jgi:hypothetical protein